MTVTLSSFSIFALKCLSHAYLLCYKHIRNKVRKFVQSTITIIGRDFSIQTCSLQAYHLRYFIILKHDRFTEYGKNIRSNPYLSDMICTYSNNCVLKTNAIVSML